MIAVVDRTTLGLNLYLLIGLLIAAVVALILLVAFWTTLKIILWNWRVRRSERAARLARLGPDGQPLPPAAPGFCDRCSRPSKTVYHLPNGQRLCPACFTPPDSPASSDVSSR